MDSGDELVQQIVRRILTVVRPDRIILFGSAGSGQMTRDSDIDLLVFEAQPSNRHERNRRREVSSRCDRPFHRPFSKRPKASFGGIGYPAHKYERAPYEGG